MYKSYIRWEMCVVKVYVSHTNTPAVFFTENVLLTGLKPTHITSTSLKYLIFTTARSQRTDQISFAFTCSRKKCMTANPVRESARSLSCVLRTGCKKIVPVSHCTCKHVSTAVEEYDEYFIWYNGYQEWAIENHYKLCKKKSHLH